MALTQGAWTKKTIGKFIILQCTVSGETSDADIITLLTPPDLDGTKPFSLSVYADEDLSASGSSAVDIWGCYTDSATLATADAGTGCVLVAANSNDIDAGGTQVIHVLPGVNGNVTQVTNASPGWSVIPPYPHYIFNVDISSSLQDAASIVFTVVQAK